MLGLAYRATSSLASHSTRYATSASLYRTIGVARRQLALKSALCNNSADVVIFSRKDYDAMGKNLDTIDRHISVLKRRERNLIANLAEDMRDKLADACGFCEWSSLATAMECYPHVDWVAVMQSNLARRKGIDTRREELSVLLRGDLSDVELERSDLPTLWDFLQFE